MLPEGWRGRVTAQTVESIGTLSAPSVFISFTAIGHDGMPPGAMLDSFDVALLSDHTDFAKAEDALDEAIRPFVRALDASPQVAWSGADKKKIGDYLAWVVSIQIPINAHQE
ncbi:hypothetical protein ASF96_10990 [Microbacterium sp. Leaf179]|nr:hypothetical protein ASF96_10990 [Microbacterium sp. Leaf179]